MKIIRGKLYSVLSGLNDGGGRCDFLSESKYCKDCKTYDQEYCETEIEISPEEFIDDYYMFYRTFHNSKVNKKELKKRILFYLIKSCGN